MPGRSSGRDSAGHGPANQPLLLSIPAVTPRAQLLFFTPDACVFERCPGWVNFHHPKQGVLLRWLVEDGENDEALVVREVKLKGGVISVGSEGEMGVGNEGGDGGREEGWGRRRCCVCG
ncbi:hypothetical protein Pyn_36652 [Prunus yedoensis var. nudiflora]|uniref:Uncharacterized protein n=1 Tax=Prunus yedoensis var. nudiflora TaxID=2094558 RepID=A0A314Z786_PRUYE|nr:hypothetical protein Pyn_36652 [Prunus yedoensis var. nudiflora]